MSKFGDKIKSVFTMDYDGDYDDEYEFEDDFEEEVEPAPRRRTVERTVREDTEPDPTPVRTRTTTQTSRATRNRNKVVQMRNSSSMEVCVIKPTHYENTKEIIDTLLEGKAVVLNLEGIKIDLAQRIVDSVIGGCYAISGNLQKISGYIYLVTPSSVDITGDFQDILGDTPSDYSSSYSGNSYSSRRSL
jgi:cell division inhibitor SepF